MKIFTSRSKKASLNLSINAIVMLILAITMLGLGLGFIRTMFKGVTGKLGSAVSSVSLKNPADANNPLTIDDQIRVKANTKEQIEIGFYNAKPSPVKGVKVQISGGHCLGGDNGADAEILAPSSGEVPPGESTGYKAILQVVKGTLPDTYICSLEAPDETGEIQQTSQFFLEVTP